MIKRLSLFILVIHLVFSLVSAATLSNVTLRSEGLNTNITLSFNLTFDQLDITNNAITFFNLTYFHPLSCNGQVSNLSLHNYTTPDSFIKTSGFPSIACVSGGAGTGSIPVSKSDVAELASEVIVEDPRGIPKTSNLFIISVATVLILLVMLFIIALVVRRPEEEKHKFI